MIFELPPLPYELDALEPFISPSTLKFHYGKHHANYVDQVNKLAQGSAYSRMTLEQIILSSAGGEGDEKKLFNNAAQAWNHDFLWKCMARPATQHPSVELKAMLEQNFDGFDRFRDEFLKCASQLFGSGWTWLVKDQNGALELMNLSNAGNPLIEGKSPILTCDVWEHAYYIDYQNDRAQFLKGFWQLINWRFVEDNLNSSRFAELIKKGPFDTRPHVTH